MATVVVIPQPIRADVDEAAVPHVFSSVTAEPFDPPVWLNSGELEVTFPTADLTPEQMDEVLRLARMEPANADLDPNEPLPVGTIPIDEIQLPVSQLTAGRMQANVSVAEEFWCAKYATDDPGETQPSETSAITKITPDIGFQFLQPVYTEAELAAERAIDPNFDQVFKEAVLFPNEAWDVEGVRLAAVFRGRVEADDITIMRRVVIQGDATAGEVSQITPDAKLQLRNLIGDPDQPPDITFGPKQSNWPGISVREVGWGVDGSRVVQGWHNTANNEIHARYIDPGPGTVHHSVQATATFNAIAGFTATSGRFFVLGKVQASDPYVIRAFDAATGLPIGNEVVNVGGVVSSPGQACLGMDATGLALLMAYRAPSGTVSWRSWLANDIAAGATADVTTTLDTTKDMSGIAAPGGSIQICTENEVHWLSGTNLDIVDPDRHWWSQAGRLRGFGLLPSSPAEFCGTNATGRLYRYNPSRETAVTSQSKWSKYDSGTDRESAGSAIRQMNWPTRTYATITAPGGIAPGTDDVRFYVVDPGAGTYRLVPKPVGATTVTIATETAGTAGEPPITSEFTTGSGTSPGCIDTEATAGDGEGLTKICGDGEFRALIGSVGQSGVQNCSAPTSSMKNVAVVFDEPFTVAPHIQLSLKATQFAHQCFYSFENVTTTGFTLYYIRTAGSADFTVAWHAVASE